MAIKDLYSEADSPYVHSNIYNLIGDVTTYFTKVHMPSESDMVKPLDKLIDTFTDWIALLQAREREIYNFCGVTDWQSLNQKLLHSDNTYDIFVRVAQHTILSPNIIRRLVPQVDLNQAQMALQKTLGAQIINNIQESSMSMSQLRNAVLEYFNAELTKKTNSSRTSSKKTVSLTDALQLIKNEKLANFLNNELNEVWIGKAAADGNKPGTRLYQFVTELLNRIIKNAVITPERFKQVFLPEYIQQLKQENIPVFASSSAEADKIIEDIAKQYTDDLCENLFEKDENNKLKSLTGAAVKNITGERGEATLVFNFNHYPKGDLELEVIKTGKLDEEALISELKKKGISNPSKMANYSLKGEKGQQSKSDNIIIISTPHGKTMFRVQSKDSIQNDFNKSRNLNPKARPLVAHMKEGRVASILDMLQNNTIMSGEDISMLSYLIANLTWFYEKGTYYRDRNNQESGGRNRSSSSGGGLAGAQQAINQIVSKGIQAFIGITLDDANNPSQINLDASNVFYWLNSAALFPVSEVLKAAVDQMQDMKNNIFNTYFRIDTSTANYAWSDKAEFWEEKVKYITDAKGGILNPYSGNLLATGREQGSWIINFVHGAVNFNFNIEDILLRSAFQF